LPIKRPRQKKQKKKKEKEEERKQHRGVPNNPQPHRRKRP
jgi:hypothetical protein